MKKTAALLCLVMAVLFAAWGCTATVAPSAAPAAVSIVAPEPSSDATAAPTAAPEGPKPMKISCLTPDGFTKNADKSTSTMSYYSSDIAYMTLSYEATAGDTGTPDKFLSTMLARLPKEPGVSGFKLVSNDAATFGSYPGYIIKWTTGANEDTYNHEAHFILTDGYFYRIEFAVSANSAQDEAPMMQAFFGTVTLMDAYSK